MAARLGMVTGRGLAGVLRRSDTALASLVCMMRHPVLLKHRQAEIFRRDEQASLCRAFRGGALELAGELLA